MTTKGRQGPFVLREEDPPDKRAGEVLVDVRLSAVTPADRAWWQEGGDDSFPVVQGGGAAGTLASGGGSLIEGSRVIVFPRVACGACDGCRASASTRCLQPRLIGRDVPGTLAERASIPRSNVVNVPDGLLPAEAACAIDLVDAWRALALGPRIARRALIVGAGCHADRVADVAPARLNSHELVPTMEQAPDGPWDLVIATGDLPEDALSHVAVDGTLVLAGSATAGRLNVDPRAMTARRQRVVGAGPGARQDLVELLKWMRESRFASELGTTFSLDTVADAFDEVGETDRSAVVVVE